MGAKPTPGPWEAVHPEGDPNALDVYPVGNRDYKIMNGRWGAMADARLIAAAPELLEALERALEFWAGDAEDMEAAGKPNAARNVRAMQAAMRAAIAKARGES